MVDWDLIHKRPIINEIPQPVVKRMTEYLEKVNERTLKSWGRIWLENLKENVKLCDFSKHSVYQFKGKHKGETAFLVGASPSLKTNIKYLKKKKGIIICCGHSLKYLLKNNIKPDYVVVVDAKQKTADWLNVGDASKDLKLLANTDAHPDTFKVWKGGVWFFRGQTKDNKHKVHKKMWDISQFSDIVVCGGSVMGASYYIAEGMGCNRVVFTGIDLANGFEHRTNYADGEIDKGEILTDDDDGQRKMKRKFGAYGDSFIDCDIQGKGIFTLARMYAYKYWFDCRSMDRPMEHINATEGGILGSYAQGNLKSMKQMRLEDV